MRNGGKLRKLSIRFPQFSTIKTLQSEQEFPILQPSHRTHIAHISSPPQMINPVTAKSMRQKPMMSLALSLAMAKAGNAQKGWIRLVHASPQAMAMPVSPGSTPRSAPAVKNTGAWMAQCPPPDGTNRFNTAAV